MAEHGLKILVVDDDDVDRMAVRRALKSSGLEASVTEAEDAESALGVSRASISTARCSTIECPEVTGSMSYAQREREESSCRSSCSPDSVTSRPPSS